MIRPTLPGSRRRRGGEVATFLRKVCAYVINEAPIIMDGDFTSGPGKFIWQAVNAKDGRMMPSRRVVRWFERDPRP